MSWRHHRIQTDENEACFYFWHKLPDFADLQITGVSSIAKNVSCSRVIRKKMKDLKQIVPNKAYFYENVEVDFFNLSLEESSILPNLNDVSVLPTGST